MRTKRKHMEGNRPPSTVQRRPRRVMTRVVRAAKRALFETTGWLVLLAGLAAIPLPGPGLLITFTGLLLLSRQYEWAERRVEIVRVRALRGAAQSVATWPRLAVSTSGALVILPIGLVWIVSPPAPLWWPVAETWWLPGGVVVGVTQLASAVIALALLGYSYQRFHGTPPEALTAVASDMNDAGQPARTSSSVAHAAVVRRTENMMGERGEMLCGCLCTSAA